MSLSARERRTLDSIKDGLAGSDPQLVALLVTFNRLASDEAMPVREKIRAGLSQPTCYSDREWRHPQRCEAGRHARWVNQHLSLRWTAPVLWLLITISLIAVALVLSHTGGEGTCTKPWAAVCPSSASARSSHPVTGNGS
jgi:Protein of unknown function (DUF3040)